MAFGTLGFSVLSKEWKVREIVIEGAFVELNDIGVAAFVVCMTGRAVGVTCIGRQAVKP